MPLIPNFSRVNGAFSLSYVFCVVGRPVIRPIKLRRLNGQGSTFRAHRSRLNAHKMEDLPQNLAVCLLSNPVVRGWTLPGSAKLQYNSKIISYVKVGYIFFRLNSIRWWPAYNGGWGTGAGNGVSETYETPPPPLPHALVVFF